MDVDGKRQSHLNSAAQFGTEVTNIESPTKTKRSFADTEDRGNALQTPLKRQKRSALTTPAIDSDDEMALPPLSKKDKRPVVS